MSIDNDVYNKLGDSWWGEDQTLNILLTWLGPVRFGYFQQVLAGERGGKVQGLRLLDVGCGGGLLSEEFARLGCQVTGIDPSEPSLVTARKHARQEGLAITYAAGTGEEIPFANSSFDVVICCDVLEHVESVPQTVQEISRVLSHDGLFLYDTVNRTLLSWLAYIKVAQDWKATRLMAEHIHLHDWQKFIKPQELLRDLQTAGLQNRGLAGMSPRINPLVLGSFLRYKRGKLSLKALGQRLHFHESPNLALSYMGYAVK